MASEVTRRGFLEKAGTVAAAAGVGAALAAQPAEAAEAADGKPMKIVGICCSPRKGKTTATALKVCLEAAKAANPAVEVELIELAGLKIPGEVAAGVPLAEGEKDDFPQVAAKLLDPKVAGIVFGTPVYFGNMSYLCKAFLDRCIAFHKKFELGGKVAGVLAVGGGRNCGVELTVRSVQVSLMSQQMIVVGDAPPTAHWGGTVWANAGGPGSEVTADEVGMATVKNLGRRVVEVAAMLGKK